MSSCALNTQCIECCIVEGSTGRVVRGEWRVESQEKGRVETESREGYDLGRERLMKT